MSSLISSFGKRSSDSSNDGAPASAVASEDGEIEKRKSAYMRFGKRKSAYMRSVLGNY